MRYGLCDADALELMRWWSANKSGGEPWSEKQIAHKIESARDKTIMAGQYGMYLRTGAAPGECRVPFPDEDERPIPNTFRRPGPMQTRLFQAESP